MTRLVQHLPALRRWLPLAVTAVLAAGLWSATSSRAATVAVGIRDFAFQPAEITIQVGDTVTWTNFDGEAHAVQGGPMSSPDIPPNGTFSQRFDEAGDVSYFCRLHTYMTGVVHVTSGGATTSTTSTTTTSTTTAPTTTSTTATTTPASTTSTTAPDGSTSTTSTSSTSSTSTTSTTQPTSGGRPFQHVPDDPSATYPPGHPNANDPPPSSGGSASSPTTTAPTPPPREFQDVPFERSRGLFAAGAVQAVLASLETAREGKPLGDGTVLAPFTETRDGTKEFHLTMDEATIEVAPGVQKAAYAFNGLVPGPVLRVDEGDRVRLVVDNQLPFATGVHWHGMILPNAQDGVPGITQQPIEPGDTFVYEWTAIATGTHWYHSHSSGRHIGKGLYGALEVVPRVGDIEADRDYRVILGDTDLGFVLNGRMFPSTATLAAAEGETVRLRVINAGDQVHAMHLHGTPFRVAAQDGIARRQPEGMDTLTISPGQTFDLVAEMPTPGQWLFHCHIFGHSHEAVDDHPPDHTGMTGMVMIVNVVDGPSSALDALPVSSAGRGAPAREPIALLAVGAVLLVALSTPFARRRSPRMTNPPTKEQ